MGGHPSKVLLGHAHTTRTTKHRRTIDAFQQQQLARVLVTCRAKH